jgi:dTMP kinase
MEPPESQKRGAFIVVEGLDRSGKTTQVKRLETSLSKDGYKVKLLRFPGKASPQNRLSDAPGTYFV